LFDEYSVHDYLKLVEGCFEEDKSTGGSRAKAALYV
jgi:hypothetical protein